MLAMYIDSEAHERKIDDREKNDSYWKGINQPDSRLEVTILNKE